MKRLCLLLSFLASAALGGSARAQIPLGQTAAVFPYLASKIVADPVRSRVYVADTLGRRLVAIDTATLQAAATLPLGSDPVDLALSSDGHTLYLANPGPTATVRVVDPDALTLRTSFALPGTPVAMVAGLNERLYVSVDGADHATVIYQFDGSTGTVQTTFHREYYDHYDNRFLQISGDGRTLFVADGGVSPGSLQSFDVSTVSPTTLGVNSHTDGNLQIVPGHQGALLGLRGATGTQFFAQTDLNTERGTLDSDHYNVGPLAFSPDDSLVYQTTSFASSFQPGYQLDRLRVFSTQTFSKLKESPFTTVGNASVGNVTAIIADRTGSYLFIGEKGTVADPHGTGYLTTGLLAVIGTGQGTLSLPIPGVTLAAPVPKAVYGGQAGQFTLTIPRATYNGLEVSYLVGGTAVNGTDYAFLKGTARFKPGKTAKTISVAPLGDGTGKGKSAVKLTLLPGSGYTVGTSAPVKVKILPSDQ